MLSEVEYTHDVDIFMSPLLFEYSQIYFQMTDYTNLYPTKEYMSAYVPNSLQVQHYFFFTFMNMIGEKWPHIVLLCGYTLLINIKVKYGILTFRRDPEGLKCRGTNTWQPCKSPAGRGATVGLCSLFILVLGAQCLTLHCYTLWFWW